MIESIGSKTFNSHVIDKLIENGFRIGDCLCLGVSGGADSICLLTSIVKGIENRIEDDSFFQIINVITVDHKIRSEEESFGDCKFVKKYCEELNEKVKNIKINCIVEELKKGQVLHTAEIRKKGIEDAARYLRYQVFEKNAALLLDSSENKKIFFALAHNQNDQLETLIMRFLSGSSVSGRSGILNYRTIELKNGTLNYVRPLLDVSRKEIETYLTAENVLWRTDSTNTDNKYLRNNIRNTLIPLLDENFPGWKNSVISGREKALYENSFIEKSIQSLEWNKNNEALWIDADVFDKLDFVQKEHFLYKGFDQLETGERIPFSFIKQISRMSDSCCKFGVEAVYEDNKLWLKKQQNNVTIYGFFDIIEEEGLYTFDFGKLHVGNSESGFADLEFVTNEGHFHYLSNVKLPFVFRSRQISDTVLTKTKGKKSVSDVLSDFKVNVEHKNLIPVIQNLDSDGDNNIVAVWGEIFGYSNWIV